MNDAAEFDIRELTARLKAISQPTRRPAAAAPTSNLAVSTVYRPTAGAPVIARGVVGVSRAFALFQPPPPSPEKLDVLKEGLRRAAQIEFATIPLYLTALWSIIDQDHVAAKSIRAVAHEEMLHLALICNLLSALGERPVLTGALMPRFPGRFPGGVHPKLKLELLGYEPRALDMFMTIERPEIPVPIAGVRQAQCPNMGKTIGAFYREILAVFQTLDPPLRSESQIAGPFAWFVMTNLDHVETALTLITAQGEGANGIPFTRNPKQLSHYYRFKSLAMLTHLKWDKKGKSLIPGKPIPPPPVFKLAPASASGYGPAAPRKLRKACNDFDVTYSRMLRLLEGSWLEGGDKSFIKALELMFDLGPLARTIMHIDTPDGRGYCPTFRYRP